MSQFFNKFPRVRYDPVRAKLTSQDRVTDIFFRIDIIRDVMKNMSSYYEYNIRDGDRPETLAEKAYGDPEAHWIILYANDILDPHYDWPLDGRSFEKYIVRKYRSMAKMDGIRNVTSWAKTNYVLFEKVIERVNEYENTKYVSRYKIDEANLASAIATTAPHDTYTDMPLMSMETLNISGKNVTETIKSERISYYDYEIRENEKKRSIRIIKKEYYGRIMTEFNALTESAGVRDSFIRRLS